MRPVFQRVNVGYDQFPGIVDASGKEGEVATSVASAMRDPGMKIQDEDVIGGEVFAAYIPEIVFADLQMFIEMIGLDKYRQARLGNKTQRHFVRFGKAQSFPDNRIDIEFERRKNIVRT